MTANPLIARRRRYLPAPAAILAMALLAAMARAPAATFDELYTVSVARNHEARDENTDAIRRAMAVLLTRITGRAGAAQDPALAGLVSRAAQYSNSYADPSRDEIRVGFNRSAVDNALVQLNMPIWGDERPATLLWIATDLGGGQRAELEAAAVTPGRLRGSVGAAASNPLPEPAQATFDSIADQLLRAADERGLPLVLPRLDEQDRRYVRFADVWGGFDRFVARAAERYPVDAVLIGRIAMTESGPDVDWILQCGDSRQVRSTASIRGGIDWIADQFAARYTIVGGASLTRLTVQGISSWPDFGRVMAYLKSVSIVDAVDFESLSPAGEMSLKLEARGDDSQLRQYLTLDGTLVPSGEAPTGCLAAAGDASEMVFVPRWLAADRAVGEP